MKRIQNTMKHKAMKIAAVLLSAAALMVLFSACPIESEYLDRIQEQIDAELQSSESTVPPSAPSELQASAAGSTQIDLAWTDNSDNEEEFQIQRDSGSGYQAIANIGADSVAYSDAGLTPDTSYTYRIRSANSAGDSSWSDPVSVKTDPPPTYSITYDGNENDGGTVPVDGNQYSEGDTVTVLGAGSLSKTGNVFIGWNPEKNGSGPYYHENDPLTITNSDVVLYAQWSTMAYELTVQAGSNGSISVPASSPVSVGHGAATTITAVPDSGYSFDSWTVTSGSASIADTGAASTTVILESGDATVTASFSLNTYQLTVQAQTGGSISQPVSNPTSVNHGAATTIAVSVDSGYTFDSWSVTSGTAVIDNASAQTTTVTLTDADATITASFNLNSYQLSVQSGAGGSIAQPASSPIIVNHGSDTAITAVKDSSYYVFDTWSVTSGSATFGDQSSNSTTVRLENGDATIEAVWKDRFSGDIYLSTTVWYPNDVFVIDIDDDGDNDVLAATYGEDYILWYENDGAESFTVNTITSDADGATSVFSLDLDGDGDIDVVSSSSLDNKIAWYENDGSENFTAHTVSDNATNAVWVHAADFNNDGAIDLVSASSGDDTIAWYENDGSENFTAHTITTSADAACSVYADDIDDDGDMDILSAAMTDDTVAWFENNGSGAFTSHTITTGADSVRQVYSIDVDGDGDIDVLSASGVDGVVAWYENDGVENFTTHEITSGSYTPWTVYAADLDGDGDIDVLSACQSTDSVVWFENDGNENFTEHILTTSAEEACRVFASDIDGDGDNDVFACSWKDNTIRWFENYTVE